MRVCLCLSSSLGGFRVSINVCVFVFDSVAPWNQLGLVVIIQLNLIALNFEHCVFICVNKLCGRSLNPSGPGEDFYSTNTCALLSPVQ